MQPSEISPYVLIVDDDPDILKVSLETLRAIGAEALVADSGAEALRIFGERPAAVVLLDVMMPDLDGFATLDRLRRLPGGSLAHVVFVTSLGDTGTQERAAEAGADDFLAKPFHPAELVVRAQSLLTAHRTRLELNNCLRVIRAQVQGLLQAAKDRQSAAAMLAHDLRGQLFNISCGIELNLRSKPGEANRARLEAMEQSVALVSRLVDDLLDLEGSPTGRLALDVALLDLADLCEQVCQAMRPRFLAKKLELDCRSPIGAAECSCDRTLVTRALCNLLDNAVRYAPSGTRVRVRLEKSEDMLHITVSDNGPGIPADLRDRIFERYARFDPIDTQRRGHGLGLAFCRMVGQLHGGNVTLDDVSDETRFRMTLPREPKVASGAAT